MYFPSLLVQILPCIDLIGRVAAANHGQRLNKRVHSDLSVLRRADNNTANTTTPGDDIAFYLKELSSALFAIETVQEATNGTNTTEPSKLCGFGKADEWDAKGYDGDYVEAWVCAAAVGDELFPPQPLDEAYYHLFSAYEGLRLAVEDPTSLARKVYCDHLDLATLMEAQLNAKAILNIICYDGNNITTSTTSSMSSTSTSSATTSGNFTITTTNMTSTSTTPTCLSAYGATGGYYCASTFNTTWTTTEPTTPHTTTTPASTSVEPRKRWA